MIFTRFKAFNLKWIRTQNCLLPSINVNQGTGSVKTGRCKFLQKKVFFHFPSLQFLPSLHLDSHLCSVCVAPMRKEFLEKKYKRVKPLLETVRSFNSSTGVIQCLNKLGHSILLISSCFCLPSSPSTLFVTIKH